MKFAKEKITPAIAASYLQKNTNNRPLNARRVAEITKEITSGRWQLTHQGIAFARDGRLIDGQHRLTAIVAAGVTVDVMVARDCDEDTFHVIDVGGKRTAADVLSIVGEKNSTRVAAALAAAITGPIAASVSKTAVLEMSMTPKGDMAREISGVSKSTPSAVVGAALRGIWAGSLKFDDAKDFCRRYHENDWNGSDDPICRLKMALQGFNHTKKDQYWLAVTALTAHAKKTKVKMLKKSSKDWP